MTIAIEIEYSTPQFSSLDVPELSAIQSGRRLTIAPRRVRVFPDRESLTVYVEGRSVIQSTGMLGQHNRSICFGTPSGRAYDDTVPLSEAPGWLAEIVARVERFETARKSQGSGAGEPKL